MSTDLRDRPTPTPDSGGSPPEKPKPALSLTQVVGGALAAMTAAALGSRLSVAGTVIGAALASVVAAVAGALYTASLRRTSSHVTKALQSRTRSGPPAGAPAAADVPTAVDVPTARTAPAAGSPGPGTPSPDPVPDPAPGRARVTWKTAVAAAVLIFLVAALALTGIELATGRALSGGSGTTVGQVAEGRTEPDLEADPVGDGHAERDRPAHAEHQRHTRSVRLGDAHGRAEQHPVGLGQRRTDTDRGTDGGAHADPGAAQRSQRRFDALTPGPGSVGSPHCADRPPAPTGDGGGPMRSERVDGGAGA